MDGFDLEDFIMHRGKELYSFCCYLTKSRQEADDLYQDTFVRVLEKRYIFPEEKGEKKETHSVNTDMMNLFLQEAVRLWKDKKRKFAWRKRITEEKFFPYVQENTGTKYNAELPEEKVLLEERRLFVRECVDRLPEKMRLVVLLYYMENRKIEEISEVLNVPPGTVKSRLFTAKKRLKKQMDSYPYEEVGIYD